MKPWSAISPEEKMRMRGGFVDVEGQREERVPGDDEVFPILAGPWPNRHIGAQQMNCCCCGKFVGLSPNGVELHRRNTQRAIFCEACFDSLQRLAEVVLGREAAMRSIGIAPGAGVLLIERRGEVQLVHNALVLRVSMDERLAGPKGEPSITAVFVLPEATLERAVQMPDAVHFLHRDWIEGRSAFGYEELPMPMPGVRLDRSSRDGVFGRAVRGALPERA